MGTDNINSLTKKRVERLALIAAIIQPIITLPQILHIYTNQSARDVSLATWLGYLVFGVIFLIYGAMFNLKPIFYGQIIWVSMQMLMVLGILIYD